MFSVLIISHYTDLHLRTEMFSVYHMSIFIKYSFNVSAVYQCWKLYETGGLCWTVLLELCGIFCF